ncbi:MAG: hypothetical protein ACXAC7_07560 [Candidatus Hodarchaeales archaeon]
MTNNDPINDLINEKSRISLSFISEKVFYNLQIPLFVLAIGFVTVIFYFRFQINWILEDIKFDYIQSTIIPFISKEVQEAQVPKTDNKWLLLNELFFLTVIRVYGLRKPLDYVTQGSILTGGLFTSWIINPDPVFDSTNIWITAGLLIGVLIAIEIFILVSRFGPLDKQLFTIQEQSILVSDNISICKSGYLWKSIQGNLVLSLSYIPINETGHIQNLLSVHSGTTIESTAGLTLYFTKGKSGPFWTSKKMTKEVLFQIKEIQDSISKVIKYVNDS